MRPHLASLLLVALTASPIPARSQGAPATAPPIVVKPLSEVAIHPEREASAQAVSLNESRISAEIPGRIESIPVRVGERIAPGAVLARIDCRDHELALDRAKASLEAARARLALAEQQLNRAKDLAQRAFISQEAYASRETEVRVLGAEREQARAQLGSAERAIEKCTVRAPFPAVVRERLGQVGELAAPGSPLVAISDAAQIEVAAQLQPGDADSLRKSGEVRFVGDGGARPVALLRISPTIERQARTVEARLRFKGEPAAAGAAGSIVWRDPNPYLQPEVLVRRGGRLGVFVAERGAARFHALPGAQEGRPARADLPPDGRLVVSGQQTLVDGQSLPATGK